LSLLAIVDSHVGRRRHAHHALRCELTNVPHWPQHHTIPPRSARSSRQFDQHDFLTALPLTGTNFRPAFRSGCPAIGGRNPRLSDTAHRRDALPRSHRQHAIVPDCFRVSSKIFFAQHFVGAVRVSMVAVRSRTWFRRANVSRENALVRGGDHFLAHAPARSMYYSRECQHATRRSRP
jgi:hypothetical protein